MRGVPAPRPTSPIPCSSDPQAPASRKFQPLRMLTNPLRKKAPEQAP